ncbi:hypothetical protein BDR03DRAFT_1026614 [Suillus americanus]|nr:hypothetical protein BDR03DRAFT_1026614 [Suillus americanus]
MQTVDSNLDNLPSASDIIDALQNILRSQAFMPDLDTPYSRPSVQNIDRPTIDSELNSKIRVILTERQQQLDAVLRDISATRRTEGEDHPVHDFPQGTWIDSLVLAN